MSPKSFRWALPNGTSCTSQNVDAVSITDDATVMVKDRDGNVQMTSRHATTEEAEQAVAEFSKQFNDSEARIFLANGCSCRAHLVRKGRVDITRDHRVVLITAKGVRLTSVKFDVAGEAEKEAARISALLA